MWRERRTMSYELNRALQLLRLGTGQPLAEFREGQMEAIRHVVEGDGRLLLVQKTGWGKSFVYFIATKLLREAGAGPALLISPLLALMRNQIDAARRMGVRASTINSDNTDDWEAIENDVLHGNTDILLISPERLANERFRNSVLAKIASQVALVVIDEAHCISDWGHDFRPHYRLVERILNTLPPNLRLLATTATANNRVLEDLTSALGPQLKVSRGDLNRPSLTLQSITMESQIERLAWLAEHVPTLPGHGIIYTLTVRDANRVAEWLKSRNVNVESYTGRTGEQRPDLERALLDNEVKALVATTALGMGFDKPDLAFVIHFQTPGSVVAYYQQVGRAGRGLDAAYGILLSGREDTDITSYFINQAFPTRDEAGQVLDALKAAPYGLTVSEMERAVNVSRRRIEHTIQLLSLESPAPIAKEGTKWQLTPAPIGDSFWNRTQRLTELRRIEQNQMQAYVRLQSGHMEFLIRALDGEPNNLSPPALPFLPTEPNLELIKEATGFLRRTSLPVQPRRRWPAQGLPHYGVYGTIDLALQAQPGRALCAWGDAGWGEMVQEGKYHTGRFSDDLVAACVDLVHKWNPEPAPEWVTCIPSQRHPSLVPDLAERIAAGLALPFIPVLSRQDNRPEQKAMANSAQQALNLDGSFQIEESSLSSGPVLLVDDIVDSRWTFSVAAWLLRSKGCGEVWPLALAQAQQGG